jgi:hypothetical protein
MKRTINRNDSLSLIIEGHRKNKVNPLVTVKIINQFDDIYRNRVYEDGFVSESVEMMAKGMLLDRKAALSWLNSDESGFEEKVYVRHKLGQSVKEISWVYGVDNDSVKDIIETLGEKP